MSDPPPQGTVAPSPAARERAIEALGRHFARDHIDVAEFERRVNGAYEARSAAELEALVSDLPSLRERSAAHLPPPPDRPAADLTEASESTAASRSNAPEADEKRERLLNVLGSSERRGPWKPPPRLMVTTVMGTVVLDFREALFASGEVDVTIVSLAAAVEIVVPPELRVELGGMPILGSFEHRSEASAPADGRLLRVNGLALLSSVEVKTLRPGEPHQPDW